MSSDAPHTSRGKHDWSGLVLTAVFSSVVGVFGTLATMRSDTLGFESASQESAYNRIGKLEDRIDELYRQLAESNRQQAEQAATIAKLQTQLSAKPNPLSALFSYVEAINRPAWIKVYDPQAEHGAGEFRMLYINRSYEQIYNVSRALYIGSSDFEIHSLEMAKAYTENDRKVIRTKRFYEFVEPALSRENGAPVLKPQRFFKFYVKLPDGRELVAGMQIGQVQ